MNYKEIHKDLFKMHPQYKLAQCISSDANMGAGIAELFDKKFNMKKKVLAYTGRERQYPTCIYIAQDGVFNLITKQNYWLKPTYATLTIALEKMKSIALEKGIGKIAMPIIGCGLDRLNWNHVSNIIRKVFADTDISILICKQ